MVFIYKNMCLLHLRMPCGKFDCKWPVGSGEEGFIDVFSRCRFYFSLEQSEVLSPFLKGALCQGWLKLAQWFWSRS